ncbi:ABC transporter substrate-binding protein [Nocardioides sp. AE5]|uniref:ABC transporter substrate-binding protein n=1 Tax=Nocardioides sp. AE5 TaxID=2962573 RepID=UPI002880CD5D|nr:ABC transporter substrate-binding protein [Nocardioides sp. AE5]MDT0202841.1 ABC transporter substrate-binding protein [Nocardioides sp. AE5]
MHTTRRTRLAALASCLALAATLGSCGLVAGDDEEATGSDGYYPITVENCGAEVTIPSEPQKLVLLKSSEVPALHSLGVLERSIAKAGAFPDAYYDEATNAELDAIESLTSKSDSSGHLQISKEVVMEAEPDLVFGEVDNLSRETLAAVKIPLVENPAMCGEGLAQPGFDDIYAQVEFLGKVFNRADEAAATVQELKERVADLQAQAPTGQERTAAVLYPTVGGGVTYAYGTRSMAHPQLEAAGFKNVFADQDERVFEVSVETLLDRNPDVLILLYSDGDPQQVIDAVTTLPGAGTLTAVRNGDILPQLFNYTEPPTPLAVDGLEKIIERFGEQS